MTMIAPRLTVARSRRLAYIAATALALTSGVAFGETAKPATAVAPQAAAATTSAVLNANAKISATKAVAVSKPRARQRVRVAAQPEQCSSFWCGRRQVSWLILGIGF